MPDGVSLRECHGLFRRFAIAIHMAICLATDPLMRYRLGGGAITSNGLQSRARLRATRRPVRATCYRAAMVYKRPLAASFTTPPGNGTYAPPGKPPQLTSGLP
jgi:hypothetical protein